MMMPYVCLNEGGDRQPAHASDATKIRTSRTPCTGKEGEQGGREVDGVLST